MKSNFDNVSVIIRNKNEERWIGHCIQSVIENILRPEIIVVDNNSNDESVSIVKHFIQDPLLNSNESRNYTNIKICNIENYTPGIALNKGVQEASRDYVLVISAHCVLKKINLNNLIEKLENYIGVFGNQNPIWNGKKINKRYLWSHFIDTEKENMFSDLENRYFFHNGISFFKKEKLKKHPFHEHLLGKEDRYWINERVKEGYKFLYEPKLSVHHHYTPNGNTWKGIG